MFGKFFVGWREEARTSKKLKSLITQFFRICIQRLRLTPQACMAFFNVRSCGVLLCTHILLHAIMRQRKD